MSEQTSGVVEYPFRAVPWLPGPHAQTIYAALFRRHANIDLRVERLELDDGDFVDLAWYGEHRFGHPAVLILHGLEGDQSSRYVRALIGELANRDLSSVVMHFRSCSGEINRLARSYHSGETGDLGEVISRLSERGENIIAAVGYSLGGNVLLKYLGECASETSLQAAAAISVPFLLDRSASFLNSGFSRIYERRLVASLRTKACVKYQRGMLPETIRDPSVFDTFWDFDEWVTAPIHGFAGAKDYYARSSSRQYLNKITTPTLIVHALDDPFVPPDAVPSSEELSNTVRLELSKSGGHVGFIDGGWPGFDASSLERRIVTHLSQTLESKLKVSANDQ
ncbi:MAG: hydrolase [Pseudomonadota bacterium]